MSSFPKDYLNKNPFGIKYNTKPKAQPKVQPKKTEEAKAPEHVADQQPAASTSQPKKSKGAKVREAVSKVKKALTPKRKAKDNSPSPAAESFVENDDGSEGSAPVGTTDKRAPTPKPLESTPDEKSEPGKAENIKSNSIVNDDAFGNASMDSNTNIKSAAPEKAAPSPKPNKRKADPSSSLNTNPSTKKQKVKSSTNAPAPKFDPLMPKFADSDSETEEEPDWEAIKAKHNAASPPPEFGEDLTKFIADDGEELETDVEWGNPIVPPTRRAARAANRKLGVYHETAAKKRKVEVSDIDSDSEQEGVKTKRRRTAAPPKEADSDSGRKIVKPKGRRAPAKKAAKVEVDDSESEDEIRGPRRRVTVAVPAPAPARNPLASKRVAPTNRRAPPLGEDSIPTDDAELERGHRPYNLLQPRKDPGKWLMKGGFAKKEAPKPIRRKTRRPTPEYEQHDRVVAREAFLAARGIDI